jgi:DNA-binding CsgD family transcriptional regulator
MKYKVLFIILCISAYSFSQSEIYFYKDTTSSLSLNNVKKKEFRLLKKQILEPYSDDVYWFKIPTYQTNSDYIFRILYERIIEEVPAYQNSIQLEKLENQRFLSYQFSRNFDVYIKVDPRLHSYIPVELKTVEELIITENKNFLLNGFYYGFAFLVIIYNLGYFFLIKDDSFLYYALFICSICFGVFTMDGMLNFYNLPFGLNNFLMILNYLFLAFFSSKFVNSYLFLDKYYPKLKKFSYFLGAIMIVFGVHYLFSQNYYSLLLLNIFVFSLLFIYWVFTVLLYKKNIYTKILSFAYVLILFSAIDFFIFNFLGVSMIQSDATFIKMGAFLEMIILSFAVLYRMKILREENTFVKSEIVKYSKLLTQKKLKSNTDVVAENIKNLSIREREIFDLILQGKSNKEIATTINISINTVKFHIKNIYDKLSIKNRKEAFNLTVD